MEDDEKPVNFPRQLEHIKAIVSREKLSITPFKILKIASVEISKRRELECPGQEGFLCSIEKFIENIAKKCAESREFVGINKGDQEDFVQQDSEIGRHSTRL